MSNKIDNNEQEVQESSCKGDLPPKEAKRLANKVDQLCRRKRPVNFMKLNQVYDTNVFLKDLHFPETEVSDEVLIPIVRGNGAISISLSPEDDEFINDFIDRSAPDDADIDAIPEMFHINWIIELQGSYLTCSPY